MADDTRQSADPPMPPHELSKEALTVHPEHKPFSGAQWKSSEASPYKPPENANMLAGGTQHTAGGQIPEVSITNAFDGGLKWSDFTDLPKKPCVRDSLLMGIGAGFAMGGLRVIFRGKPNFRDRFAQKFRESRSSEVAPIATASNWAAGTFCLSSAGMYQYCHFRRSAEKEGVMRAVEILNRKELEKKAREARKERLREERRELKDKEQDAQFAALREKAEGSGARAGENGAGKSWWKVW
nr:cytochrome c oxidase protein 20, mitochondrial [Quercus suber]